MSVNNLWSDINLMLDDIKKHSFNVIKYDDAAKKLLFGFKSTGDDTVWLIKLSNLSNIDMEYIKFTINELVDYLNLTNDERIIKNIIE